MHDATGTIKAALENVEKIETRALGEMGYGQAESLLPFASLRIIITTDMQTTLTSAARLSQSHRFFNKCLRERFKVVDDAAVAFSTGWLVEYE
jgi:hypothetical protein